MSFFKKYKASIIGILFSLPGIAAGLSFIVIEFTSLIGFALITMVPTSLPLEYLFGPVLGIDNYALVALFTTVVIFGLYMAATFGFRAIYLDRKKNGKSLSSGIIFAYFFVITFLLHPLFFEIWAFMNADSSGDGQFLFGLFSTLPISSIGLIITGIVIDRIRNNDQDSLAQQ